MQQTIIVHNEQINRKGEIKYFQIPLPGVVKKIIAVEASIFLLSNVEIAQQQTQPEPTANTQQATAAAATNGCPNPGKATIDLISDTNTGINGIRTQVFRIGAAVNPGFIYQCGVYSVVVSVTAVDGDTPETIASKLATEVNNTSLAVWNQYGSNNRNYKPTAVANRDELTLTVDSQHSFFASGIGECSGPQPPPPPPPPPDVLQFDPLFFISRNEKAGTLSLQSPDATDIFYQCEAYREDKNINYGDFSYSGAMVGEWLKGRKRYATEVLIRTESPILEAYYKDILGEFYGKDLNYQLNIFIWFEKIEK
jgi:hypothetical protein